MSGTEQTPEITQVLYRWDNHQQDREDYDMMFDEAMDMVKRDETALGGLIHAIINEWERNRRNIPMSVLGKALEVCEENKTMRELHTEIEAMLPEPEHS